VDLEGVGTTGSRPRALRCGAGTGCVHPRPRHDFRHGGLAAGPL